MCFSMPGCALRVVPSNSRKATGRPKNTFGDPCDGAVGGMEKAGLDGGEGIVEKGHGWCGREANLTERPGRGDGSWGVSTM